MSAPKKLTLRDFIRFEHTGTGYMGHGCRQLGFATDSQDEETTAETVIMRDKAIVNAANDLQMTLTGLMNFLHSDMGGHLGDMFLQDLEPQDLHNIAVNMMMPL